MKPSHILTTVIVCSGLSSAWPWPQSLDGFKALSGLEHLIYRRQGVGNSGGSGNSGNGNIGNGNIDNGNSGNDNSGNGNSGNEDSSPSNVISSSGVQISPSPTSIHNSITPKPTGKESGAVSSGEKSTGRTSHNNTSSTSVPSDAYPGGVNLLFPNTLTASSQYYAMSSGVPSTVTWVWNYTSLMIKPNAVDIVATIATTSGGVAPSPFTLSSNVSYDATQTFKWDTGAYAETSQMPNGVYTLQIFDADAAGGATAIPQPGRLEAYAQFQFGVYQPSPYIAVEGIVCVTCNAAGGKMERLTWGVLTGVVGLTMATAVWFTGANGVW